MDLSKQVKEIRERLDLYLEARSDCGCKMCTTPCLSVQDSTAQLTAKVEDWLQEQRKKQVEQTTTPEKRKSRFKGVSWHKRDRRWIARTSFQGRVENLGSFGEEELAGFAVDLFVLKHKDQVDTNKLNFPQESDRQELMVRFKNLLEQKSSNKRKREDDSP